MPILDCLARFALALRDLSRCEEPAILATLEMEVQECTREHRMEVKIDIPRHGVALIINRLIGSKRYGA